MADLSTKLGNPQMLFRIIASFSTQFLCKTSSKRQKKMSAKDSGKSETEEFCYCGGPSGHQWAPTSQCVPPSVSQSSAESECKQAPEQIHVPGYPEYYNIVYDDDQAVYVYKLLEDYKAGDLKVLPIYQRSSLLRELGLLRRRTIAGSSTKNQIDTSRQTGQSFKYLIVIDFESTCWKDGKFRTQEIIEFPAVLLNTSTGEIESEFHHYVQPQEQPTLSEFCTELTGITQDKVDDGIPLNLCLRRFRYWLDKLHKEKGVLCTGTVVVKGKQEECNTTCVTWSDWDLGVCLQYECKRKQILKPTELTSWIDLRATYRKFYQRKPNGLNGALQDLGIHFQGREHSGVDDARNTANLAYRLMQDGCQLKVTKTLKNHERSASCSPTIGAYFKAENVANSEAQKEAEKEQSQNHSRKNTPSKIPIPVSKIKVNPVTKSTTGICNKHLDQDKAMKTQTLRKDPDQIKCAASCEPKATTPIKLKLAGKRKEITPLKIKSNDKSVNSPCRKAPRQFTPKKFYPKDIYVDSPKKTINIGQQTRSNLGLKEHDMNLPGKTQSLDSTNKVNPANFKISSTSITSESVFKVPNPLTGKRIVNSPSMENENMPCKNFCASTPVNGNSKAKPFISGNTVSPVQDSHQFSTSGTKTPNCTNNPSISGGKSVNRSRPSDSSIGLKMPNSTFSNTTSQSTFFNKTSSTSMKMTPPLCRCGRRSKRKMVQSPGQNMGRFFFSCAVRKGAWCKEGCDFFKWEVAFSNQNSSTRNNSSSLTKQYTPVTNRSNQNLSTIGQKKSLGIRPAFKTPVCIR